MASRGPSRTHADEKRALTAHIERMHESQTLLRFRARDGFLVHAYFVNAASRAGGNGREVPILLQIHGSLGHFLARGTPRLLPHALRERGYHSLSINTRLASAGQMTSHGIFDDTPMDIEAAVAFLRNEGFRNVFVLGYSLGAAMVAYWASRHDHAHVRGLILEGVGRSIPDRHRRDAGAWGSSPAYEEIHATARSLLGVEPRNSPNDETFAVYRSRGPTREPSHSEVFTYKTWWYMVGPEAHGAMAYRHVGSIRLPILMLRGEKDERTDREDPEELARLAREAGNRHVRVRHLPGAGHDCMENAEVMLDEIQGWFSEYGSSESVPG
jgi:alpha-beta hydrolase superfamily lysophospholipase